jgi:CheY-like chemotaxis protein
VETLSLFKFFVNRVAEAVGDKVGEHFVAITDPDSKLAGIAEEHDFRASFVNDPNIGGRFSALSYFGLVPAALVGVDVGRLLDNAVEVTSRCGPHVAVTDNPAAQLGAILGELARAGRNKVTFAISPAIASFGDWVEQLVAESTGKEGRGILPVVREPLGQASVYGFDRLFVHLRLEGDEADDTVLSILEAAGHPVVRLDLHDVYDLGGQFFLWELATAVAGYRLGINPFDQPNVESAKVLAREMVTTYQKEGRLPALMPALKAEGIAVYSDKKVLAAGETLDTFLSRAQLEEPIKIVCIEDEADVIDLVTVILEREGVKVIGALGGKEGLEAVRREKPDVVLLDLMMPGIDGWEVYQQMRADETAADIPVIVITAKAQSIDKMLGLQVAKVDDYIAKPFTPQELRDARLRGSGRGAPVESPGEALLAFLGQTQGSAQTGSGRGYIALQAYLQPTPETTEALTALRVRLRDRYRLATTLGYGPRFLHSTGQLHKGDAGNGLFIQFTADDVRDVDIPDEIGKPDSTITFGVLKAAQALGDRQALLDTGRRVIRFHLGEDVVGGLSRLTEAVK